MDPNHTPTNPNRNANPNPSPNPNPNQADVASKAEKAYELASNVAVHTLEPSPSHSP